MTHTLKSKLDFKAHISKELKTSRDIVQVAKFIIDDNSTMSGGKLRDTLFNDKSIDTSLIPN